MLNVTECTATAAFPPSVYQLGASGNAAREDCYATPTLSQNCVPREDVRVIRVIHIDRDEDVREIVALGLGSAQDAEFELLQFESLEAALTAGESDFAPDIVVTAYHQFADRDGSAPAQKCLQAWPNAQVVYLTTEVNPTVQEALYAHGVADIVSKPFDPIALPDRLKSLLSF